MIGDQQAAYIQDLLRTTYYLLCRSLPSPNETAAAAGVGWYLILGACGSHTTAPRMEGERGGGRSERRGISSEDFLCSHPPTIMTTSSNALGSMYATGRSEPETFRCTRADHHQPVQAQCHPLALRWPSTEGAVCPMHSCPRVVDPHPSVGLRVLPPWEGMLQNRCEGI